MVVKVNMIGNEELTGILEHLIEVCHQSQMSYLDAVKGMRSLMYRAACAQHALQRESFVAHLRQQVHCVSGKPALTYGALSKRHCQHNMTIRAFLQSSSEEAILKECLLREEAARVVYEEILEMMDLQHHPVYDIIEQQYEKIVMACSEITDWLLSN